MGFYNVIDVPMGSLTSSTNSEAVGIHHSENLAVQVVWTNDTAGSGEDALTGKVEVQTITFPAGSVAVSGDYFAVTDTTGSKWAVSLQKKNVETITFPAKSSVAAGDTIIVYDTAGVAWGISLNKSGTDPEPTSALYVAIPAAKKVHVDISSATTGADIAGLVETAVDALVGFSTVVTTTVSTADIALAQASIGYVTPAIPLSSTGGGAGAITAATTVLGANEPTGAIWAAIPAAQKAQTTITAAQTNAQVAAAVETVFDGLTDVPFTSVTTLNAIALTSTVRGNLIDAAVKNKSDSTAGTITAANTTQGIDSAVNVTDDTLTLSAHGYTTGLKGQVSISGGGTLPTGLSASTDYFVIVVDANTVKLATSLANALAGTAIDIEDQGTADKTVTFTPTALAGGVVHLECSVDKVNWFDVASMTANMTASSSTLWHITNAGYMYVRLNAVVTAGQVTVNAKVAQKGEGLG
jgi:hypothetical protein